MARHPRRRGTPTRRRRAVIRPSSDTAADRPKWARKGGLACQMHLGSFSGRPHPQCGFRTTALRSYALSPHLSHLLRPKLLLAARVRSFAAFFVPVQTPKQNLGSKIINDQQSSSPWISLKHHWSHVYTPSTPGSATAIPNRAACLGTREALSRNVYSLGLSPVSVVHETG